MNETRINRIIQIFSQLGDLGGARERTKILPNREVVDAAPAGLTNYIIVEDEGGYYIPAVKVPGISYSAGDLVNILFIEGTEPIAFQQGSGSGGGSWPISDALPFVVKNTSGGAVSANAVGYIDEADEFKTTTTAYAEVDWCVVLVGGANNADIYVARRGRVTVTLNGNCSAQDFLYTSTTPGQAQPLSTMRPEVFARTLTANAAGAGGTCEALLLTERKPYLLTSTNDVLDINGASDSDWQTTENGAPVGAVVTYNTPLSAGAEDAIVPAASTQLCKLVLHNVTRGESAYISSVNTGANTITVTAAADVAAWQNGNTLEVRSQTNTDTLAAGIYFFDLYAASTEIPVLAVKLEFNWFYRDSAATNQSCVLHPYVTGASSKRFTITTEEANVFMRGYGFTSLINRRFTISWDASGASTGRPILKLHGVTVAAP